MKVFSASQIREIDSFTIKHEPIASIDLMERAAHSFVNEMVCETCNYTMFCVLAGTGNNGGDGLAVARILASYNKEVVVFTQFKKTSKSVDYETNIESLKSCENVAVYDLKDFLDYSPHSDVVIVDALFGTGLSRPVKGIYADVIEYANTLVNRVYAIDIPSGLYCDKPNSENDVIVEANVTISFQFPKYTFFFSENEKFLGSWRICDIGLHNNVISSMHTTILYVDYGMVPLQHRKSFSHKGTYGHACVVAGSVGKSGAAVLAASSCLKAGAGLVSVCVPDDAKQALLTSFPEIMTVPYTENLFSSIQFSSVGIGPGIGVSSQSVKIVRTILQLSVPKVLDADALNCIAQNKDLLHYCNDSVVLTPHPGEFDRLTHEHHSGYERVQTQSAFAQKHGCYVLLKGAYSSLCTPDGYIYFNSTGNPGMATAGSGDVLTGIVTSLLSQGYSQLDAAISAMFVHGLAGDIALHKESYESLIAQSIITNLSASFNKIRAKNNTFV
ncbi:MAG: NAD(P)H-hydrate dehydratase [Bacteroidales bacterium]